MLLIFIILIFKIQVNLRITKHFHLKIKKKTI